MKIIEKGYMHNKIFCTECHCEYEYDYHDIMQTVEYEAQTLGHYEVNYVRCPMCGKKKVLSKEYLEPKFNIGISAAKAEEQ